MLSLRRDRGAARANGGRKMVGITTSGIWRLILGNERSRVRRSPTTSLRGCMPFRMLPGERRFRRRVRGRGMACIGFFMIRRGRVGLYGDFTIKRRGVDVKKNVHRTSCEVGVQFSRRIFDSRGNGRGLRRAR